MKPGKRASLSISCSLGGGGELMEQCSPPLDYWNKLERVHMMFFRVANFNSEELSSYLKIMKNTWKFSRKNKKIHNLDKWKPCISIDSPQYFTHMCFVSFARRTFKFSRTLFFKDAKPSKSGRCPKSTTQWIPPKELSALECPPKRRAANKYIYDVLLRPTTQSTWRTTWVKENLSCCGMWNAQTYWPCCHSNKCVVSDEEDLLAVRWEKTLMDIYIITVRNSSCGKVLFTFYPQKGCLPHCMLGHPHPRQTPWADPLGRHPPRQIPPGSHPLGRHTPSRMYSCY